MGRIADCGKLEFPDNLFVSGHFHDFKGAVVRGKKEIPVG
jgi:hypothetical protein